MAFPVLGTAQLGMAYGIANKTGMPDMAQAGQIISHAVENGVEQLDTAQAYGESELVLGKLLRQLKYDIKIISKIHPDIDHTNHNKMESALADSLKKLSCEHLYGYMIHNPDNLRLWNSGLGEILMDFQSKGVVRHIGISVYSPSQAMEAVSIDGINLIQIPSNLIDRRFEKNDLFQKAERLNKTIYIRSIFLQGLLLMHPEKLPSHMKFARPVLKTIKKAAETEGFSQRQLAIGYAKEAYPAAGILFGTEAFDQIKENLEFWYSKDIKKFSGKLVNQVKKEFNNVDEKLLDPSKWHEIKTLAILQARMSSSRLPKKVMKTILEKPMLELQIERVKRADKIDKFIVATSTDKEDDPIAELCHRLNVDCFRGSLDNVLDRFYQAGKQYNAQNIVRLTGDCPLTDPEKIDDLIEYFYSHKIDYASNCTPPTLPDGLDAEILTMKALKKAKDNAVLPSELEHVTPYITDKDNNFSIGCKTYDNSLAGLRWCVDNPEDFIFVKKIYENLYKKNPEFTTKDILNLLDSKPELIKINSHINRNEGVLKALEIDREFIKNNSSAIIES